jgi:hypothetical protein
MRRVPVWSKISTFALVRKSRLVSYKSGVLDGISMECTFVLRESPAESYIPFTEISFIQIRLYIK